MIEVELRTVFDEEEHRRLEKLLKPYTIGRDDRHSLFFFYEKGLVKITNYLSKEIVKLSYKNGRAGDGNLVEIEMEIPEDKIVMFEKILDLGKPEQVQIIDQNRENFLVDGVEIALKFTESWGHHLEAEIVIEDNQDEKEAEDKIRKVGKKFGIEFMSDKEINDFRESRTKFEKNRNKN
jgi:adenylate cyclase class IV